MIGNYYFAWYKELSHEICQKLINLGKGNWNRSAVVNKSVVGARKSDIVWTKEQWVYGLISPYMFTANEQAGWKYNIVAAEDCQVTRYTKDGFYTWHKDGMGSHPEKIDNSDHKLLYGNARKLSMSIFLNSNFEGGNFQMQNHEDMPSFEEGSVIVFPSFMEHRVTPVTKGIRYSLVTWFVGPPFI